MVLSDVLRCVLYNILCPCWFWPWYCLTFFDVFVLHCLSLLVLAMVLSDVLRCVLYNIVCPCWFWPWYRLTFFDSRPLINKFLYYFQTFQLNKQIIGESSGTKSTFSSGFKLETVSTRIYFRLQRNNLETF